MTPRSSSRAALVGAVCLVAMPVVGPAATAQAPARTCGGSTATIVGTAGFDDLTGTSGPDVVYLGTGDDTFDGRGGDDIVCGGGGSDRILGGEGDDTIFGGDRNDRLHGGEGDDTIRGEDGNDVLAGQDGDDTMSTGPGRNVVLEGAGDDSVRGGGETDRLSYLTAGMRDGTGVRLSTVSRTAQGFGTDSFTGIEVYELTRNTDSFRGGGSADFVEAAGGADTITTGGGDDVVFIGTGATRTSTGTGDDQVGGYGNKEAHVSLGDGADGLSTVVAGLVAAGDGDDYLRTVLPSRLDGGAGSDTVQGSQGRDRARRIGVVIDLTKQVAHLVGARGLWHLSSIENAAGSPFDDVLLGTRGANVLRGFDGDDRIDGRGGDDTIDGGWGEDTVTP